MGIFFSNFNASFDYEKKKKMFLHIFIFQLLKFLHDYFGNKLFFRSIICYQHNLYIITINLHKTNEIIPEYFFFY